MPTLQSKNGPGGRITAGNAVLAAAKTVDIKPVNARFQAFRKVHEELLAADDAVTKAETALTKQEAILGEKDAAQDSGLPKLAGRLAGDGLPRMSPFKPFGFKAPSEIARMSPKEEGETIQKLVKKVLAHKGLSKETLAEAKSLGAGAGAVIEAEKPIAKLASALKDARTQRDALGVPWERAFSALKRAARTAGDDGHTGIYEALFVSTAKPVVAKARAAKVAKQKKQAKKKGGAEKGEDGGGEGPMGK